MHILSLAMNVFIPMAHAFVISVIASGNRMDWGAVMTSKQTRARYTFWNDVLCDDVKSDLRQVRGILGTLTMENRERW